MGEDRRARRVDAHREVVGDQRTNPVADLAHAVAVGDHLVVGHEHEGLDAGVLQAHPVGQRPEVVPDVQVAGRPVAGEHAEARGVLGDLVLDRPAALLRAPQGRLGGRGGQGVRGLGVDLGRGDLLGHGLLLFVRSHGHAKRPPAGRPWCAWGDGAVVTAATIPRVSWGHPNVPDGDPAHRVRPGVLRGGHRGPGSCARSRRGRPGGSGRPPAGCCACPGRGGRSTR